MLGQRRRRRANIEPAERLSLGRYERITSSYEMII